MQWRFIEFLYNWHVFIDLFMELESPQLCCDQTSNIIYLFILNGIGTIIFKEIYFSTEKKRLHKDEQWFLPHFDQNMEPIT